MREQKHYGKLNKWIRATAKSDLPKMTRYVLMQIGTQWMDENLSCYPSQRLIAERIGLGAKYVNNHIDIAEKQGWLKIIKKIGSKQGWKLNHYRGQIPGDKEFNKFTSEYDYHGVVVEHTRDPIFQ